MKGGVWGWRKSAFKSCQGGECLGLKQAARGTSTTWRLHIFHCWDTSLQLTLFFLAIWLCLQLVALHRAHRECATTLGNASTMSEERRERVRKRRGEERCWWNVNVLSCSISISLVRGWNSLLHCDARIHETVGGTTCRSESTLSLVFLEHAYPHTLPYTDNINISCLVSNHAWGIPPPCWCVMFILLSCWSALCRKSILSTPPRLLTRPLSLLCTLAVYLKASHKFLRHWVSPLTPGGGRWGICWLLCVWSGVEVTQSYRKESWG